MYKMKIKSHSQEQKQHYKNLECSNLYLEKTELTIDLKSKKIKMMILFALNLTIMVSVYFSESFICKTIHNF